MANNENLKSLLDRDIADRLEIARKGGIKSGKVRKSKSELKKRLEILLSLKDELGHTEEEKICVALLEKAKNGNIKAFEVIRDTLGQHPRFDPSYSNKITLASLSKQQLKELRDMLLKEDEEYIVRHKQLIEDYIDLKAIVVDL